MSARGRVQGRRTERGRQAVVSAVQGARRRTGRGRQAVVSAVQGARLQEGASEAGCCQRGAGYRNKSCMVGCPVLLGILCVQKPHVILQLCHWTSARSWISILSSHGTPCTHRMEKMTDTEPSLGWMKYCSPGLLQCASTGPAWHTPSASAAMWDLCSGPWAVVLCT